MILIFLITTMCLRHGVMVSTSIDQLKWAKEEDRIGK